MKTLSTLVIVTALVGNVTLCAANQEHIGIVKSVAGEVVIVRINKIIKAEVNTRVLKGDLVKTGPDGKVGLLFEDDAVISMGSNTKVVIEQFMFQPAEKKMSFIARIIQGTASFLSGQLAKLAPNEVHIETPYATIGMRGTHVLIKVD